MLGLGVPELCVLVMLGGGVIVVVLAIVRASAGRPGRDDRDDDYDDDRDDDRRDRR